MGRGKRRIGLAQRAGAELVAERGRTERRPTVPLTAEPSSRRLPPTGDLTPPPADRLQVRAEVHTDDQGAAAVFDAAAWFAQASDEEIVNVATENEGWGHSYASDAVATFFADDQDVVGDVFAYQSRHPQQLNGDTMGFEVELDEEEARAWITAERPHLLSWIDGDSTFTTPNYRVFADEVFTDDGRTEEWSVRVLATDEIKLSYPEQELAIEAAKALEASLTPPEGGELF